MTRGLTLVFLILPSLAIAGQPTERFRGADHMTFSQGSADPRYGNADANVRITLSVFILGTQVFNGVSSTPEARFEKAAGSLDFTLRLSDFDPTLPPDVVTMIGQDLGNDALRHTTNTVLPGPYHLAGNFGGTAYDITVSNVRVTASIDSKCGNDVTAPWINPVLSEFCDVQFDDPAGANNTIVAIPAQVSGWVVSPIFTVNSVRVDVTGIQQAGQVPAKILKPSSFTVGLGRLDAGTEASLGAFDGDALRVCKFIVPNQQVAPVNVQVFGSVSQNPSFLSLLASSRMTVTGVFQQTLEMYDFSAGGYATGDTRTDSIGTAYEARKLDGTGSTSRYIGQNGEVRARYQVRQTGPAASNNWCAEHDLVGWILTP